MNSIYFKFFLATVLLAVAATPSSSKHKGKHRCFLLDYILNHSKRPHPNSSLKEPSPKPEPRPQSHSNTLTFDDLPYIVKVTKNGEFVCTGFMISDTYAVTSANCVNSLKLAQIIIQSGSPTKNISGNSTWTIGVQKHPLFPQATSDYDIAILQTANPVPTNGGKKATFITLGPPYGLKTSVAGWGENSNLESTEYKAMDQNLCKNAQKKLTQRIFCAKPTTKRTCNVDLGSPMIYRGHVIGIATRTGCGNKKPSVYLNVIQVRDFIDKVTRNKAQWFNYSFTKKNLQ